MVKSNTNVQSEGTGGKVTKFRWLILLFIFIIYTVAAADRGNMGFALPFIRKEFHMTNTEAGMIISLFSVAYAIAQLPAGFTYSKVGVRKIFSFAMIATSAFTGMMGLAHSALWIKVCRVGLGLSEGPVAVGLATAINNWFPAKEKGFATGFLLKKRDLLLVFLLLPPSLGRQSYRP